jgi:hypothetical protein
VDRPEPGTIVRLFDGDGNTCFAVVERVDKDVIHARLDLRTWQPAIQLEEDLLTALQQQVSRQLIGRRESMEPTTRGFEPDYADLAKG